MPVNQLALDRRLQHADPRTLLRGAGDDRIERLADARPQQQGGRRLPHLPLDPVRGVLLLGAVRCQRRELVVVVG